MGQRPRRKRVDRINVVTEEVHGESWKAWPVFWSAIWVGMLSALATGLIIGLIGLAVGAHVLRPDNPTGDIRKDISLVALIFSIVGAFASFVVGGWVAGKIAGI